MNWKLLMLTASLGAVMYGDEITLPLDNGNIVIRASFIGFNGYTQIPELTAGITNQTSSEWPTLKLQFDVSASCAGNERHWSIPATTALGWRKDYHVFQYYKDIVIALVGEVKGCKTESIKASLILAENADIRIDGVTGERVDYKAEREAEAAARAAAQAAQAEEERKAADAQYAAEEARRKRLAAEQKRKQVEAAEDRKRIRAACTIIYQNTVDKKVKDLTVREEQQVRACQVLGLYPPH